MAPIIPAGGLIFDIGACQGAKAMEYLGLFPRQIVCVEPQPKCASILRTLFTHADHIAIEEVALSSYTGEITLYLANTKAVATCSKHFMENTLLADRCWNEEVTVPTKRLDDLIEQYGIPDFCKIDVEGHELAVVQGLSHALPVLSFEFHAQFSRDGYQVIDRLLELGEYRYNLTDMNGSTFALKEYVSADELIRWIEQVRDPQFRCDIFAVNTP